MAITKPQMRAMIMKNGHLRLEGNEKVSELHTALLYLRQHTVRECRNPDQGIAIEILLPDTSVLTVRSKHTSDADTVAVSGRRL